MYQSLQVACSEGQLCYTASVMHTIVLCAFAQQHAQDANAVTERRHDSAWLHLLCILRLKRPVFTRGLTARAVVQRLMDVRVTVKAKKPLAVWTADNHANLHAGRRLPLSPSVHTLR